MNKNWKLILSLGFCALVSGCDKSSITDQWVYDTWFEQNQLKHQMAMGRIDMSNLKKYFRSIHSMGQRVNDPSNQEFLNNEYLPANRLEVLCGRVFLTENYWSSLVRWCNKYPEAGCPMGDLLAYPEYLNSFEQALNPEYRQRYQASDLCPKVSP